MTNGTSQGLYIIVAVVIFGIFTLISYLLFQDSLTPKLTNIFETSFETMHQAEVEVINDEIIAKINQMNETTIFVKVVPINDKEAKIVSSGLSKTDLGEGNEKMTGSLYLPDKIGKYTITEINNRAFYKASFQGTLKLPKNLKILGQQAFILSKFTGNLNLPITIEEIGVSALESSRFTGNLSLPPKLKRIEMFSFRDSKFTGSFIFPKNLNYIGEYSFSRSRFSGEFKNEKLTYIGSRAFTDSTFTGVLDIPNVKMLGFYINKEQDLESKMHGDTFYLSLFDNVILNEDLKIFGKTNIRLFDKSYYA